MAEYVTHEQASRQDAERAWAQLHLHFVAEGLTGLCHTEVQMQAYDQLAAQYPRLAGDCRMAITRLLCELEREAERKRRAAREVQ